MPDRHPRPREPVPARSALAIEGGWPAARRRGGRRGKVVGALTSVPRSPATADAVALGDVRREVEPPADGRRCAGTPARPPRPDGAAPTSLSVERAQAGIVTTKRVPPAVEGLDAARRRPSRPRARGRSRGRSRCPTLRPGVAAGGVEPLEHPRRVRPGRCRAVVVDVQLDAAVATLDADPDGRRSRTSTRSRRGWRRSARAVRGRRRPAPASPRVELEARRPARAPTAGSRRRSRRTTRARVDRVGASARTGARRAGRGRAGRRRGVRAGGPRTDDHVGGADAQLGLVDGAVGDRLGVALDRRERRAQVVRHAEQERALVTARGLELVRPSR